MALEPGLVQHSQKGCARLGTVTLLTEVLVAPEKHFPQRASPVLL